MSESAGQVWASGAYKVTAEAGMRLNCLRHWGSYLECLTGSRACGEESWSESTAWSPPRLRPVQLLWEDVSTIVCRCGRDWTS